MFECQSWFLWLCNAASCLKSKCRQCRTGCAETSPLFKIQRNVFPPSLYLCPLLKCSVIACVVWASVDVSSSHHICSARLFPYIKTSWITEPNTALQIIIWKPVSERWLVLEKLYWQLDTEARKKTKNAHIHSRTGGEKMDSQEEAVNGREVFWEQFDYGKYQTCR